ncbi:2'-5' RNA ligase [Ruminococcus albus SY3]|uniref:2'-5' RNA ligase n=1 Tax=Ruminococcus albus SY3 TaxID=1341156 RepID=A0A011UFH1_RUMAL|nr:2'-5' RNA ligase family protein [Ruminococcus albus]EXM39389.1 2'-5' RNA ligase [Ruminococcus albus SY3]
MENKALYVLAGYDSQTEEYLSGIQEKLYAQGFSGVHTKGIPMHMTLGSLPTDMEEKLKKLVTSTAESTAPFDVTFNHVGIFGGANVLFTAPDVNHDVLALKEKFGDSKNWTAHTTFLIDSPEVIYKALHAVMQEFKAFGGKVISLHMYEFFPTRHILTVGLKAIRGGQD